MKHHLIKNEKSRLLLLLSGGFAVTFLCLFLVFQSAGVGLFGPKSILISDMKSQYTDFFMALRNGDVFYSNGIGLSGSFAGTFAYYLSSPFSLLIFLFSKERLQSALLLIFYLKLSLSTVSFGYMLHRVFKKTDWSLLLFSLCYSLMSFGFFFFINLFWMDALIWLPLLVLFTKNLAETGKIGFLPPLLGVLFFSNFYIAYIVGLFLLLFFLTVSFGARIPVKEFLLRLLKLAGSAALAAGMAAAILLPALKDYSMSFGVEAYNGYGTLNFTGKQFLLKLFPGVYDSIGNYAAPTIFCGFLVFILAGGFFFLKSVKRREKIAAGALIVLMLLSFLLPKLDIVWHAFSYPNAFAYRYAFCFSFLLIYLAATAFYRRSEIPKQYFLGWLIPALLILLFQAKLRDSLGTATVAVAFVSIIAYTLLLLFEKMGKNRKKLSLITIFILIVCFAELSLNGALILRHMQQPGLETSYPFPEYAEWVDRRENLLLLLDQAEDSSLSRVAGTDREHLNEMAALGVNGVSSFSSCYSPKVQQLFRAVGYGGDFKGYWYLPGNPAADRFFGVRYLISEEEQPGLEKIAESGEFSLYENSEILPLFFGMKSEAKTALFTENPEENMAMIDSLLLPLTVERESMPPQITQLFVVESWEKGTVRGSAIANETGILQTTLPFDQNYVVRIDGQKVKTFETFGSLLAVDLLEGNHTVEITYYPKQAYIGAGISLVSIAGFIGVIIWNRKRNLPEAK